MLDRITLRDPAIPYINNVEALEVTEQGPIRDLLKRQVSSSVRWQQSVEKMLELGIDTFVEIGPGKTLSGFLKRIDRTVKCMNVDKLSDLDKVLEELGC